CCPGCSETVLTDRLLTIICQPDAVCTKTTGMSTASCPSSPVLDQCSCHRCAVACHVAPTSIGIIRMAWFLDAITPGSPTGAPQPAMLAAASASASPQLCSCLRNDLILRMVSPCSRCS